MIKNRIYSLVKPGVFVEKTTEINENTDAVLVRPRFLSICHADQRYYQGQRAPEVLAKKLPMALIHEGIGEVLHDPKEEFPEGMLVAMVPNTPVEEDEIIAENYLRSSKFRASGFDGFMQDVIDMQRSRLVPLPEGMDTTVAAFTELAAVSYHTINRFDRFSHARRNRIGIWGDGNLAYITSLLLKSRFPQYEVCVFGIDETKMREFTFADGVYNCSCIPEDLRVDHAFECVGSAASGIAINQIIDFIHPEGTIAIMGVSEELVPIHTRMVLEKGLRIFGSSRCGVKDFRDLLEFYRRNPDVVQKMKKIVGEVLTIHSLEDMNAAFEADAAMPGGKTVMIWEKEAK